MVDKNARAQTMPDDQEEVRDQTAVDADRNARTAKAKGKDPVNADQDKIEQEDSARTAVAGYPDPDARKAQFEAEQEGRAKAFERDQGVRAAQQDRAQAEREEQAEEAEKLRVAQEENDELAFQHGLITPEDIASRRQAVAGHPDALLPHQVLDGDEETVKMGFPRHVVLVLPASDPDRPIHYSSKVFFHRGFNDVPVSLADHWYLHDAGAFRVDGDGKPESESDYRARVAKDKDDDKPSDSAQVKSDKAKVRADKAKTTQDETDKD